MRRRALIVGLIALALAASASAQTVYLAFGDSITFGIGDSRNPPGYPPRLENLLEKEGENVSILNFGVPGDATIEALARIDAVLSNKAVCIIIMLGTNDVQAIADGKLSYETAIENTRRLVQKSRAKGLDVILATIIPRSKNAKKDRNNLLSVAYTWRLRDLAFEMGLTLADPWERWDVNNDPDSFDTLYSLNPDDFIGHPNSDGYKALAELLADIIQGRDTVGPVPGEVTPSITAGTITKNSEISTSIYEHKTAAGINRKATALLINGRVVSGPSEDSTQRKVTLSHKGKKALGCRTVLTVRSEDKADPPNVIERVLALWNIEGRTVLVGDVDFDCRVDGFDMVSFGYRFGATVGDPRFLRLFDFNNDGKIDGADLSRIAKNFGKSSK